MGLGCVDHPREIMLAEGPVAIDGTGHEDAHCKVGLRGHTHLASSAGSGNYTLRTTAFQTRAKAQPSEKDISKDHHSANRSNDPAAARLTLALASFDRMVTRAGWVSVLAALLWIGMAACVATLVGRLVEGDATPAILVGAVTGFLGLGGVRIWLNAMATGLLDEVADRVMMRERAALIESQDRLSPRAARLPSASVGALLVDKLPQLAPFIRRYRPAALRVAVVPAVLLLVAFTLSWTVAMILLVAGPLIPVFMALVGWAARDASARQMDEIGTLSGHLAERLAALVDIRLLDAGDRMVAEFTDKSNRLRDRTMAVLRIAFLSSAVLELFSALGVAMVAVYVGFALLGELQFGAWATPLTVAEGVFLLMIAPEFFQPLRDLAAAWHDKAGALAVAGELAELEAGTGAEILGAGEAAAPLDHASAIAVSGLRYGAVQIPDFQIEPGQSVAITGASGRGKSTLIALLGGLEAPDGGDIRLDGVELTPATADGWRAQVAWVPQDVAFPPGPLSETLLLGAPSGTTDADIAQALQIAAAEEIVARLPNGLNTALGEAGGGVSGGEARRLMLVRAALSRRPVLLADEPTADLDPETAALVIRALLTINKAGTTVIVATHDPALIAAMGRRIDLDRTSEGKA
jgi:ATP-binding cassette subfamily C protein CydD